MTQQTFFHPVPPFIGDGFFGVKSMNADFENILKVSEFQEAIVVGGHNLNSVATSIPASITCGDLFLKPLLKEREGMFYVQLLREESKKDEYLARLEKDWIPKCLGTTSIRNVDYLVLQNLYTGFSRPCILDLKMGTQTFEDDAPMEKKEYEVKKFPLQRELGFRITGLKKVVPLIHKSSQCETEILEHTIQDNYLHYRGNPKTLRRQLTTAIEMKELLHYFFSTERGDMWPIFESKVQEFLATMKNQHTFRFIASSLLFIYEGDDKAPPRGVLGMIDFAHVVRLRTNSSIDEGYVHGLETILNMMSEKN